MTDRLRSRTADRLEALRRGGLLRHLHPPSGLDLSSNDYLGLARDPRVVSAFAAAAREECGSTGSRLLRGDRACFHAVEQEFAAFKHTAGALYFSSGYLANLAVLTTLPESGDLILSDARNHASLIDGTRLSGARRQVYRHRDVEAVAQALESFEATRTAGQHAFVVTESVFSMDGDEAPLVAYAALCRRHDATLVVDEAHAVGLFGRRGSGLLEDAGLDDLPSVSINSAGKALGVSGAFVAGPDWAMEYLVQRARPFVFSTAAPPAVAAAIETSLRIVAEEPARRQRVLACAAATRQALRAVGVPVAEDRSPIVPILIGENEPAMQIARTLSDQGFDIRAIRPPTVPVGTARLRVSVNASLEAPVLDRFVAAYRAALEALAPWPAVYS
jgi:8-amino-7-oxononanoate synthase